MTPHERSCLQSLDDDVRPKQIRAQIDQVVQRVARRLAENPAATMAWEPIPLEVYGPSLPADIRSSWVFILRAGATTGAERHPNSRQRMMSYQGQGDLQTGGDGIWQSHWLVADERQPLERRWVSIASNVWHQAVVPADGDWVVVSFHTVPADELIEERPDATQTGATRQRQYLAS